MQEPITIAQRLRTHRAKIGVTQETAAHEIGVTLCTYARWELGLSKPRGLSKKALSVWLDAKGITQE